MRRFGLLVCCFVMYSARFPASTGAQNFPSAETKFHKQHSIDWGKKLKLNDEQKRQLDAIYAESQPQIEALKEQMKTLRQQMDNIRADDEKKIRAILDEKQAAKFDKIQERKAKQNRQMQPRVERRNRFKMRENKF